MRTIEFRGRDEKGEWHYGNLLADSCVDGKDAAFISPGFPVVLTAMIYRVDPATVGQFTGLTDKNGNDVYEGDILRYPLSGKTYQVVFKDGIFWGEGGNGCGASTHFFPSCEIIGNIYDNPEMIKKGGDHE